MALRTKPGVRRSRHGTGEVRGSVQSLAANVQVRRTASDVVVTKPGSFTVSLALAVGRPLRIRPPVPKQKAERRPSLVEQGVVLSGWEHHIRLLHWRSHGVPGSDGGHGSVQRGCFPSHRCSRICGSVLLHSERPSSVCKQ